MRTIIAALIFICLATPKAQAQTIPTINLYGGYVFRDKVSLDQYYGYVNDAAQYGGGLEFTLPRNTSAEIKYLRMDTRAPLYYYNTGKQENKNEDKISVNYILLGGTKYLPVRSTILPYAGFGIGVGIADSKDDGGSLTKFAYEMKLGVKVKTASLVSLKFQTQFQSMVQGVGGGLYIGTGGSGAGVSTYSSIFQFGFSGGLSFSIR